MLRNSLAKRAGGRRAAGASSRRFVRARAMVIASHHANVACGATRLPWLPVRFSSSPRARWNRLEQAEQAAPPAARRGAERDRGKRSCAPRHREHMTAKVGACEGTAGAMLSGSKPPSPLRRALREHNAALPDRHLPPHARAPAAQICTQ